MTADSVRWHDAAHVQARDGACRRGGVVRVRSPAVSSTVRGSDCQVDGRVVSLSIRRSPANPLSERSPVPSRADIRVLLSGDVCSALTDTAVYRFPGTLSTASYGRQPLWLTCDDMRVPDVVSAPSGTPASSRPCSRGYCALRPPVGSGARAGAGADRRRARAGCGPVRDTASGAASHGLKRPVIGDGTCRRRRCRVCGATRGAVPAQRHHAPDGGVGRAFHGHRGAGAQAVLPRASPRRVATGLVMAVSDVMLAIVVFPSDSVLRALLMGLFGAAAVAAGRRRQSVSSLSWTVIIVLLIAPSMSVSYGFALSCAAVLGIVLFAGPLTDAWRCACCPDCCRLRSP